MAILGDGSTDKALIEMEVVSVIFTDPETSKPVIKVFERIALSQGQETATIKAAIKETFKMNSLESTIFKTVFLSPESALVNCSKNSDLIKKN